MVGVSVDSADSHRAFASRLGLNFPLLADTDGKVSRRYGALNDFAIVKFAKRHTFLIDPDGRIAKIYPGAGGARPARTVPANPLFL